MTYTPIKPIFPGVPGAPGDPVEPHPFLASVPLPDGILASCIVEARVTGVYNSSKVNVKYMDPVTLIEKEYYGVPVWAHTDVGTRGRFLANVEHLEAPEYFRDSASMFPFSGNLGSGTEALVGLLLYQPPKLVESDPLPEKEALGVCCIFDGFFSLTHGLVYNKNTPLSYMARANELGDLARRTYHPYMLFTLAIFMIYGIDYYSGAVQYLVNLRTGAPAVYPTYYKESEDPGDPPGTMVPIEPVTDLDGNVLPYSNAIYDGAVPGLPFIASNHTTPQAQLASLAHMNAFLHNSIRIRSEDCWQNYSDNIQDPYPDDFNDRIACQDYVYVQDYNSSGVLVNDLWPDDDYWGFVGDAMSTTTSFKNRDTSSIFSLVKTVSVDDPGMPGYTITYNYYGFTTETLSFNYTPLDQVNVGVTGASRFKFQYTKNTIWDWFAMGQIYTEFEYGPGVTGTEKMLSGTMTVCQVHAIEIDANADPDPFDTIITRDPLAPPMSSFTQALEAVLPYARDYTNPGSNNWKTTRIRIAKAELFFVPYDPRIIPLILI